MTCYSINEKLGFFTYRSTRSSPSSGFPGWQSASKKVGFFRDTKNKKLGEGAKLPDPLAPMRRQRDPGATSRLNRAKSGGCPSYANWSPLTSIPPISHQIDRLISQLISILVSLGSEQRWRETYMGEILNACHISLVSTAYYIEKWFTTLGKMVLSKIWCVFRISPLLV